MGQETCCPHCGVELYYDDEYNSSYDGSRYESYWRGHCPACGTEFKWKEIYLFDRVENFEEMENEENE